MSHTVSNGVPSSFVLLLLLATSASCLFTGPIDSLKQMSSVSAGSDSVVQRSPDFESTFIDIYTYENVGDGGKSSWKEAGIVSRASTWTQWEPATCCTERTAEMRTLRANYAANATWSWEDGSVKMDFSNVEAILGTSVRKNVSESSNMSCDITRAGAIVQIQVQVEMAWAMVRLRDCSKDGDAIQCSPWSEQTFVSAPTGTINASCRDVGRSDSPFCKVPGLPCEFTALGEPVYQSASSI
ncbi:AaceriAGL366Cp [[Ashbya] aceris (nom. inval.)]|nr:AaceriAGL366Cp [[Ashbya] aceris (nom. inval.)]